MPSRRAASVHLSSAQYALRSYHASCSASISTLQVLGFALLAVSIMLITYRR
jgi:hypothetical protein